VHLHHLTLHNFRNYVRLEIDLPAGSLVLQGKNAQGKSNLLEAIYYLATTRSPYAGADQQLISWAVAEEAMPFARLDGQLKRADGLHRLEITLVQGPANGGNSGRLRKTVSLDGRKRRAIDYLGAFIVVMFRPEDIDLIAQGPSLRRRYMDITLSQIDERYRKDLARYNQVISQRNALLRQIQEAGGDLDQLAFWDDALVSAGSYLILRRQQAIARLDEQIARIHPGLTGGAERLRLVYVPRLELGQAGDIPTGGQLPLRFDPQFARAYVQPELKLTEVKQQFQEQLAKRRPVDLARGVTTVGPHRDDLRFLVDGVDMTTFGSRGQQRTAALSLKLAEVAFMREEKGESPVLLLDDIMSELDEERRGYVAEVIRLGQQVIVTATDVDDFPPTFLDYATLRCVEEGRIAPVS
jgi:DNA replication and repair protein RecF